MSLRARSLLALVFAGALPLISAGVASSDVFGPIALVSAGAHEQAGFAHDVAISANGRYVVFDGVFEGKHGVWRRDLASNQVVEVAGDRFAAEGALRAGDAALPSISENGQYVSFTTTAKLAPHAEQVESANVYVRNMDIPEQQQEEPSCEREEKDEASLPDYGQSCPFTLVSAANGKSEALTYAGLEGSIKYGAVASGRTAISADGRQVAFVTTAISNLLDPAHTSTPAMQVAVRNTATRTTQLVSVRDEPTSGTPAVDPETGGPEAVRGAEGYTGAVYSDAGSAPPEFKGPQQYTLTPPLGASISADGSTVAWLGVNIAEQAQVLPGEAHLSAQYNEPLWRRIADGPAAHTRRITGGSDPESPACAAGGEQVLPEERSNPCQGPFYVGAGTESSSSGTWKGGEHENFLPQLSADGYTVAFLAQAPTLTREEGFARGLHNADLYVANMHSGLTRTQAMQPLTELASGDDADLATTGSVVDFGIAPDGTQVAFSTQRTQFPLGVPAYVSAPLAEPGMSELFDVDLANSTLTRVTQSFEGGAGEHAHQEAPSGTDPYGLGDGALSPSFSGTGNLLAFASTAANIVYGDGNTPALVNGKLEQSEFDGSDAFLVGRIPFVATPTETYVSGAPAVAGVGPQWQLGVTAASLSDGKVRLYVSVPGAGKLLAGAESVVRLVRRVRGHAAPRKGRRATRSFALAMRRVADMAKVVPATDVLVQLTLALSPAYRSLASTRTGLPTSITVTFIAPGQRTLKKTIAVSFKRKPAVAKKRRGSSLRKHS